MAITISGDGITSANIADSAITSTKIADSAITSTKIADSTITTDDISASDVTSLKSGRKNLIINGGFDVWQRGTSFSNVSTYHADRWRNNWSPHDVSKQIENNKPFVRLSHSTATTPGLIQNIEMDAYTDTFTASFKARSTVANKTISIYIRDHSSVNIQTGSIPNLTTSWQTFTYTFTNITSSNGISLQLYPKLDASGHFDIKDVQLELGDTATDFEHRSYGEELALCQRYYQLNPRVLGVWTSASAFRFTHSFTCKMRTTPTVSLTGLTDYHEKYNVAGYNGLSAISYNQTSSYGADIKLTSSATSARSYGEPSLLEQTALSYDAEL